MVNMKLSGILTIGMLLLPWPMAVPMELAGGDCEPKSFYGAFCDESETRVTLPEDHASGFYYSWELRLAKLAGADPVKDSEELLTTKIRAFIKRRAKCITCDSINLKKDDMDYFSMCIALGSWDFVNRAINLWDWPMNGITDKMGRSLADVVYEEYIHYRRVGGDRATKLLEIYKACRAKGAKHIKVDPSGLTGR